MTFIKYTNDGKAVIQPAALVLSGLEKKDTLEMHTLDNTIVLLKANMTSLEKFFAVGSLIRLVESLAVELEGDTDDDATDDDDEAFCDDTIPIPAEAFEDAGIWGKNLRIQVIDGAVVITADKGSDDDA